MGALFETITQMRHPLTYAIDIVGGVRALGVRRTRRMIVGNVLLSTGVGAVLTTVGAGAVEATTVIDPAAAQTLTPPAAAEVVGIALGASAVGGLIQGVHQISKEGQAARESRQAERRRDAGRDSGSRDSAWLR